MKKEKILDALGIVCVSLFVIFVIWLCFEIKEMLNDYRCSNLPLNEFFQDEKCEKYWRYKVNE